MPVCSTVGCDYEALFAATCTFCSMGKLPGPEEVAGSSRPKTLAKVNVAKPTATFMGGLNPTTQEANTAATIAGNASSKDGSKTTVGGLELHHHTTPRVNFSIWFTRDVTGHKITVYGIGTHVGAGNKKYSIQFHDGSTKTVTLT